MPISGRPPINVIAPNQNIVDPKAGTMLSQPYLGYFAPLDTFLASIQTALGPVLGVNSGLFTAIPTLGAGDAGYVYFITDYRHLVYWTGAAWNWLDGDQPGKFQHFIADPGTGWALCNGLGSDYLSVGATITKNNITLPDLTVEAYLKSTNGGGYTGTPVAALAPGISGSTAGGTTGTGTTGTGTTGTENSDQSWNSSSFPLPNPIIVSGPIQGHTHSIPGLSIPGLSVPALGSGSLAVDATGDQRHLIAPCYFRR